MAKPLGDRKRLGEVLLAAGLLTAEQLERALATQRTRRCRLGEALVQEGVLSQDQINWALAQHFGLAYVDVQGETLDAELIRSIRPALLYQHRVIPLVRVGNTITLAMADPTDSDALLEVSDTTGREVEAAIGTEEAILAGLDSVFSPEERRLAVAEEPSADRFADMAAHPVPRQRLGEILVDALLITPDQLQAALASQKGTERRLGEVLIETGTLTEDQINWALARHLDIPYIDIDPELLDPDLLSLAPPDVLLERRVVPVMRVGHQLILAMADPLDHEAIAEMARASGCDVLVAIARRRHIAAILAELTRAGRPASASTPFPVDVALAVDRARPAPREGRDTETLPKLPPEAAQAFKETLQHCSLPADERIRVYNALHGIAAAGRRGGREARRTARQQSFAALTPAGMKVALRLLHQVGRYEVPILKDEEFTPKHGRAGTLSAPDRRFIVDRREYDRTIAAFTRDHKLNAMQVDNAVMAARAYVATGGAKEILLITEGEKRLAQALTKVIRLASTREQAPPGEAARARPKAHPPGERRRTPAELQQAVRAALAEAKLTPQARDKVLRIFRVLHRHLGGTFDRDRIRELIRKGIFAGFSRQEIRLVERIMRAYGYDLGDGDQAMG